MNVQRADRTLKIEPCFVAGLLLSCIVLRASISFQSSRAGSASIPADGGAKALNASTSAPEPSAAA